MCDFDLWYQDFPGCSAVKNLTAMQEPQKPRVRSLGQEDPRRRAWQSTPVFLPGESHGQRSLAGYSPWGRKESDMTEVTSHIGNTCIKVPTCWHLALLGKVENSSEQERVINPSRCLHLIDYNRVQADPKLCNSEEVTHFSLGTLLTNRILGFW